MDPPSPDDDDTDPDGTIFDAKTIPRCQVCLAEANKGGGIMPDEESVRRRWGFCAFGDGWSWCATRGEFNRR